ncbi:MAG: hypothetical protein RL693_1749 [Verrucomicrobiota bacterium]|jgi:farnesyl-diphosphate farnesyltransferase
MMQENDLGGKLLVGVSRSFYLTLKALPEGLREPLSLAYLLARAADTLADTSSVPGSVRLELLREFDRLVQGEVRDEAGETQLCDRLRIDFMPLQEDQAEARLLERLPEALEAFRHFPARQMIAMRGVLDPIVRGQILDIERFPEDGSLRALQTSGELDDYTWLVAGCVGEFWTRLCAEELTDAFSKGTSTDQMIERGIRYGKGLQLVNILRDIGKDSRLGRCYFPQEELLAHGLNLSEIHHDPSKLMPVMTAWHLKCREHLEGGLEYVEALEHKRLRYATALPLLLGYRTLALIEKADAATLLRGVKVSRGEVTKLLFDAGLASLRRGGIGKMVEKLRS